MCFMVSGWGLWETRRADVDGGERDVEKVGRRSLKG